jgi:phage major head subunit gpT-like protein
MNIDLFTTRMREEFLKGTQIVPLKQPDWDKFTLTIPSTARFENYAALSTLPVMRRYVGHRQYANVDTIRYPVENLEMDASIEVPLRDVEDDQIGLYPIAFKSLGERANTEMPGRLIIQQLALGNSTVCFDGSNFFATAHNLGAGNSALPANYGGGVNLLTYTAQGSADARTYKIVFLVPTDIVKPAIWQVRKPVRLGTNSGESRSLEAKTVRYWCDAEVAVAYGWWWQALMVTITNTPTIPDCYSLIDTALSQLRSFTLPQSSPSDPLLYANQGFLPTPDSLVMIVPPPLGQVFWHTLSEERIGVNVAGSSSGFTNNIYRSAASLVISGYMA